MVLPRRPSRFRLGVVGLLMAAALASCGQLQGEPAIQIASTGSPGSYLVVLDNCPALREVSLVANSDTASVPLPLWRIVRESPPANVANFEVELGDSPNGWATEVPFEAALRSGVSYRIEMAPGNRSLEVRLDDLADLTPGQAVSDQGTIALARADATQPCDGQAAWGNLWRQGAVFLIAGLLILLLLGTVLVKMLQVVFAGRLDHYGDDDDDLMYDSYPDDWEHGFDDYDDPR